MHKKHFWVYIISGMTIGLLLPLALLGWLNFVSARNMARVEITENSLPLTRDNIYSEIHTDLLEPLNVATTMANDSFLKDWVGQGEKDLDKITNYLFQIHRKYEYFSVFFVSADSQKYYHFRGLHKVISERDTHDQWYYRFLDKQTEYVLDVDTDEAGNNELTIFLNFRVEDENKRLLGVTGVGMKMDTVSRLLKKTGDRFGRHVFLVNRDGVVQAHANPSFIHRSSIRGMSGICGIAPEILSSLDHVTNLEYILNSERVYVTSRYMPELGWFLIVTQDESNAISGARENFVRTLAFGGIIWLVLVALMIYAAHRYHQSLAALARLDELTRLGNRRQFEDDFVVAQARFNRNKEPFALILMDLDGFKVVNDKLGHLAGDAFLKAVADAIRRVIRPLDRPARWGGDEFTVLGSCNREGALELAERIRAAVKNEAERLSSYMQEDPRRQVSVSCGVVPFARGSGIESMLHEADQLLYECKRCGGNCVRGSARQDDDIPEGACLPPEAPRS